MVIKCIPLFVGDIPILSPDFDDRGTTWFTILNMALKRAFMYIFHVF